MNSATAALHTAATANSIGMVRPAASMPAAASAPTTMNSAFMMLLAAMMRAPCSGLERCCTRAYSGTMKKPPKMPIRARSSSTRQVEPWQQASAPSGGAGARARRRRGRARTRQADRAQRHQAQFDALGRELFAEQRADADAEGEGGQQQVTAVSLPPSTFLV
jgi:hypothetical protein